MPGRHRTDPVLQTSPSCTRRSEPVAACKTAIRAADALLIATPEYNHVVPGVL
jgi:NAD(P)H-dependent FMN reductase